MYVYFRKNMHTYICTHLRRYTHVCVYVSCVLKLTITYLISDVNAIFSKLSELRAQKERENNFPASSCKAI